MSIFSDLHQITQNSDALVELAQNKEQALSGASDEEIESAVDRALEGRDDLSRDEVIALIEERRLTEDEIVALMPEQGEGLTEEAAIALINEHAVSEERVVELLNEHAPDKDLSQIRARIDELYSRTNKLLDDLEKELSRVIGPEEPSGDEHSNPGWGLHFTTEEPIHFSDATVRSLASGTVNVELWSYSSGDTVELVDTTEISLPTEGVHDIDLDIDVEEPGEYLLTRDQANQPEDFVSLWRMLDYTGWEDDSDETLTLHGSGHNEFSDNRHWYYFFNLHVESL